MTQEDKQLLFVDLCARLPYPPVCHIIDENGAEIDDILTTSTIQNLDIWNVKPYLRPMSSMTEEENEQWLWLTNDSGWGMTERMVKECIDFLNKKMFDYRGLIPKGQALSTEEYNPYKD